MERGELRALYVIGENPVQSEADQHHATHLLGVARSPDRAGPVPDRHGAHRRRRASRGRRGVRSGRHGDVERAARAARAPHQGARRSVARRPRRSSSTLRAATWATTGVRPDAERVWNELRTLSPVHAGMSYAAPRSARRPASGRVTTSSIRARRFSTAVCGSVPSSVRERRSRPSSIGLPVDKLD